MKKLYELIFKKWNEKILRKKKEILLLKSERS